MTPDDIKAARDLIAKANNGPWAAGVFGAAAPIGWAKALDEIERLTAEQVKDLADVDRFRGMARMYMDERDAFAARKLEAENLLADALKCIASQIEAQTTLKAENARLRKAIKDVRDCYTDHHEDCDASDPDVWDGDCTLCLMVQALAGKETT